MIRIAPYLIALATIAAWPSCTNQQSITDPNKALGGSTAADSLFMTFERTPCFGKCPAFRVIIYRNGNATYEGTQFSDHMGMHTGNFGKEIPLAMLAEAERIGFFELEKKYDGPVTDLPSMITEIRAGEKHHKVLARLNTPKELKEFGKYMDELINGVKWTPVGKEE